MSVRFFVPGIPQPKGSKNRGKGWHMYESANRGCRTRPAGALDRWMAAVATAARVARAPKLAGPVRLGLVFVLPRPKKPKFPVPAVKPDTSKLLRAVEDALNDIAYEDDARIVDHAPLRKVYVGEEDYERPGVDVLIEGVSC